MTREWDFTTNRTQRMEIRTLDPDFGLSKVELQARCPGKAPINENLLKDTLQSTTPETLTCDFSPSRWGLAPGDRVTYWAIARG